MKVALVLCFFAFSCELNSVKKSNENTNSNNNLISVKDTIKVPKLLIDTLVIEGKDFIVFQSLPGSDNIINLTIINNQKDTIYLHSSHASNGFEIIDFDSNGILDIILHHVSNIGGVSELIVFDTQSKSFKEIKDFSHFASPNKINNSSFWYSYQRNGCADENWESKLFKIENFQAIEIGKIEAVFCENDTNQGIYIYKIIENKKTLINPKKELYEKHQDKEKFIKHYWSDNYILFD